MSIDFVWTVVDVAIPAAIGIGAVRTAYLGVRVTLSPPTDTEKARYKREFVFWGIFVVALTIFQGWRNHESQVESTTTIAKLQNTFQHTHFTAEPTSLAVTVRDRLPIIDPFGPGRHLMFNISYTNVGQPVGSQAGMYSNIFLVKTPFDLKDWFTSLDSKIAKEHGWRGGMDMVSLQTNRTTTPDRGSLDAVISKRIKSGAVFVYVVGEVLFTDTTGDYKQEICYWLQPPSFSPDAIMGPPVWHGCDAEHGGIHSKEMKLDIRK